MKSPFIIHGLEGYLEEGWLPWLKKENSKNHKIYKLFFINNINIHPGDLKRSPDDYFSYCLMNINGDLI